jgi:hypothetical protein
MDLRHELGILVAFAAFAAILPAHGKQTAYPKPQSICNRRL